MRPLSEIRIEIDAIDDQVIALLARRFALLPEVVAYKNANNLPATIPARVQEVLGRNEANAISRGIPVGLVHAIYDQIITAMCKAEAAVMIGHKS